ncbi:MAG TPA: glycosyltransferase family 1 protein [Candidatus Limnocylindrales bacterium]|nr:glycosyltransferase family 1 protein [Candidatus Limnocylindrales bacterium]
MNAQEIHVEIIGPPSVDGATGIGRTLESLLHPASAAEHVHIRVARQRSLPLSNTFTPLKQLPLAIEKHRPGAIVHFAQIVGCAQLRWNPVHPALVTVHDLGVLECAEDAAMFNAVERTLLNLQFRGLLHADAFACVSRTTAQSLATTLGIPAGRIHITYHAIDRAIFRHVGGARGHLANRFGIAFKEGQHTLLYVGNELPRKNLFRLLEALAICRARGERLRLIKVGDSGGPRWRNLTLAAAERFKLGVGTDILFAGRVADEDLPYFHAAADAFVTASLLEGFGLPVAEAMACGTPVACSNAGALPEITGGAAALFDPHDPENIASVLTAILHDSARLAEMRSSGWKRADSLNREAHSSPLLAIYEALAWQAAGNIHHTAPKDTL